MRGRVRVCSYCFEDQYHRREKIAQRSRPWRPRYGMVGQGRRSFDKTNTSCRRFSAADHTDRHQGTLPRERKNSEFSSSCVPRSDFVKKARFLKDTERGINLGLGPTSGLSCERRDARSLTRLMIGLSGKVKGKSR